MELCEHGNTFNCLQCEVKFLKYVIEEQQKEIAEWKELEFRACSKHHEFIDEIERSEKDKLHFMEMHSKECKSNEQNLMAYLGEKEKVEELCLYSLLILHLKTE